MSLTDPVADLLTRIRNAINARQQKLDVPASKLKLEIARILKEEGYLTNFKATEEGGRKLLRLYIKYGSNNDAAISNLARILGMDVTVEGLESASQVERMRALGIDYAQGFYFSPPVDAASALQGVRTA